MTTFNSSSRGLDNLFWPLRVPEFMLHIDTDISIHMNCLKKNIKKRVILKNDEVKKNITTQQLHPQDESIQDTKQVLEQLSCQIVFSLPEL